MVDTYRVKFVCGALTGEWLHGQTDNDVIRLYNTLGELTKTPVGELVHHGFAWDMVDERHNAYVWRGVVPGTTQAACLYVMREFSEYE